MIPSDVKTIILVVYSNSEVVYPHQIALNGTSQFYLGHIVLLEEEEIYPYRQIAISRDKLSLYSKMNPYSFYFSQNQNYRFINEWEMSGFDLYLVGLNTDTITTISLTMDNPGIIYLKKLKTNIQLIPNQSITISGSLFEHGGLNLSIEDRWGDTIHKEF